MLKYKKCRIVSADLIGQGQSEQVGEYSLNLFVSQFAEVINHYQLVSEETHLLCHGFGCVVGALLSQQYTFKSVSFVAPLIYQKPYDKTMYRQGLMTRLVQSLSCGRSHPDQEIMREYDVRVFDFFPSNKRPLRGVFRDQISTQFLNRDIELRGAQGLDQVFLDCCQFSKPRVLLAPNDQFCDYSKTAAFAYHQLHINAESNGLATHDSIVLQPELVIEWMDQVI